MPRQDVRILDPKDYQVVWIAPLEIEARAALRLLDERHNGRFTVARGDEYIYHAGSMCDHNIVIATLPAGQEYGTGSAGALSSQVKKFFPNLWFGLLVGVAAGLPNLSRRPPRDIRLGDVLVGLGEGESAGLIAYDLGKETSRGFEPLKGGHVLATTEAIVRSAIGKIKVEAPHDAQKFLHYYEAIQDEEHADGTFADPGQDSDHLYLTKDDGTVEQVERSPRPKERRTRVWYGPIGSGEKLLKNAKKRDELRDKYGLVGLEMEAAGTMNRVPVGVIRGVCDYGDEHKNKEWQPFAAAMAAAYGKAVLAEIVPVQKPISEVSASTKPIATGSLNGPYYCIQSPKNGRFTGREAILETLEETLFGQEPCERAAVVGLGGIGKTQVALRFVYQVKESKPDYSIFWIPILNSSSLEQAYTEIAKKIGLRKSNKDEDVKELVRQYLSSGDAGKWLMVVDNADDHDLFFGDGDHTGIEDFLPQSEQGSILLTTRSRQVAEAFAQNEVVDLEQMNYDEALPFLKNSLHKSLTPQDEDTARDLLTHLTYLPLAIAQAAAYLNQTKMPIHRYLDLLRGAEKDVVRVLGRDFRDNTRYKESKNAVGTTWLVSFEQIQKTDPAAANVLSFLSCIEPKAIPQSILPKCESPEELEWAIGTLCGYSFIVRRGESDTFDMHHLVQLATRGWIEKGGRQEEVLDDGVNHLANIFPTWHRENRDIWREYFPHAFRVLARTSEIETNERAKLCSRVGQCLQEDRRFREALDYLKAACHYMEKHSSEDDPNRLESEHALAMIYTHIKKTKKAIEMLEHVVSVEERTLDEHDSSRLASEHALACAYHYNKQTQKAIEMLEHIVEVQKSTPAEDDHARLTAEHALASAYVTDGRTQQAIKILEHIAAVEKTTLAEDDEARLSTEHELARAYEKDGQNQKAIEIYEHVVSIRKTTLAEQDSSRLSSEHNLANAYNQNGQVSEAIELFEHVVLIQETTLAKEHPHRLSAEYWLGRAYLENGQFQKAIEIFEHVLSIQQTILAEQDHNRLESEYWLAYAYYKDSQFHKAIEQFKHVVSIRQTILAEKDDNRLSSEYWLARAYHEDRQFDKAVEYFKHVVSIQQTILAEKDYDRLDSEFWLARAYFEDRQFHRAIEQFKHVVSIRQITLAKEDTIRLSSEHWLAYAYCKDGRSQEAVGLLEHVVAVEESLLQQDDPERLVSVELLHEVRTQLEAEWETTDDDSEISEQKA
ncbi:hypothetical protein G7054_g2248 [Neopestalotiopsis clavispora]|nr:hypothetical protein G7054_g2248 [Neopestalotiopsis clavispora]